MGNVLKSSSTSIESLVDAALTGNLSFVKIAVTPSNVNDYDKNGNTALLEACRTPGNERVVNVLLTARADVNQTMGNTSLWTPLTNAVHAKAGLNVITALVEARADVCATTSYGFSVLHCVGFGRLNERERIEIATYLLAHGAQSCLTYRTASGRSPATLASTNAHHQLATLFLEQEKLWRKVLLEATLTCVRVRVLAAIVVDYLCGE